MPISLEEIGFFLEVAGFVAILAIPFISTIIVRRAVVRQRRFPILSLSCLVMLPFLLDVYNYVVDPSSGDRWVSTLLPMATVVFLYAWWVVARRSSTALRRDTLDLKRSLDRNRRILFGCIGALFCLAYAVCLAQLQDAAEIGVILLCSLVSYLAVTKWLWRWSASENLRRIFKINRSIARLVPLVTRPILIVAHYFLLMWIFGYLYPVRVPEWEEVFKEWYLPFVNTAVLRVIHTPLMLSMGIIVVSAFSFFHLLTKQERRLARVLSKRRMLDSQFFCRKCRYDLTAPGTGPVCPECGTARVFS